MIKMLKQKRKEPKKEELKWVKRREKRNLNNIPRKERKIILKKIRQAYTNPENYETKGTRTVMKALTLTKLSRELDVQKSQIQTQGHIWKKKIGYDPKTNTQRRKEPLKQVKEKCQGNIKNGKPCKNYPKKGGKYCRHHEEQSKKQSWVKRLIKFLLGWER